MVAYCISRAPKKIVPYWTLGIYLPISLLSHSLFLQAYRYPELNYMREEVRRPSMSVHYVSGSTVTKAE